MNCSELRKKTLTDLQDILKEQKKKLAYLCFNLPSGKVKNVKEIKEIKKNIARILTVSRDNKQK